MSKTLRIGKPSTTLKFVGLAQRNAIIIFLILSFFLILISRSSKGFNDFVYELVYDISTPFFYVIKIPVNMTKKTNQYFVTLGDLKEENRALKMDNMQLKTKILSLYHIEEEIKSLEELLNSKIKDDLNFVTSKIFINNSDKFAKLAIIDKGQDSNIKKGQAVIASQGLVGRILKTNDNFSHVLLINDLNSKIPVYTAKSREKAIMQGRSEKLPELNYLNPKHKIEPNEIVYTSGDGLIYPKNIPVGTTSITEEGQVLIIPFINFHAIESVKILQKD